MLKRVQGILNNAARKKATRTSRAKAKANGILNSVRGSFNKVMKHPATKTAGKVGLGVGSAMVGSILASKITTRK